MSPVSQEAFHAQQQDQLLSDNKDDPRRKAETSPDRFSSHDGKSGQQEVGNTKAQEMVQDRNQRVKKSPPTSKRRAVNSKSIVGKEEGSTVNKRHTIEANREEPILEAIVEANSPLAPPSPSMGSVDSYKETEGTRGDAASAILQETEDEPAALQAEPKAARSAKTPERASKRKRYKDDSEFECEEDWEEEEEEDIIESSTKRKKKNDSDDEYDPKEKVVQKYKRKVTYKQPRKTTKMDERFEKMCEQLLEFKNQHGHVRVPTEPRTKLGNWVRNNKRQYHRLQKGKDCSLTDERIAKLKELGVFEEKPKKTNGDPVKKYNKHDEKFDTMCNMLKEYKAQYGHALVPTQPRTALGNWVENIRTQYRHVKNGKKSTLTMERMVKLKDIGFVFNTRPKGFVTFEERLQKCRDFLAEHGHLRIPTKHPELGDWVGRVRWMYLQNQKGHKTALTPQRQQQLDEMGFVWLAGQRMPEDLCKNRKTWEQRFQDFVEWKNMHGHPYVPQHDPSGLGGWVSEQRVQYKFMNRGEKSYMTMEKALRLSNEGFAWDASNIRRTPKSALEQHVQEDGYTYEFE